MRLTDPELNPIDNLDDKALDSWLNSFREDEKQVNSVNDEINNPAIKEEISTNSIVKTEIVYEKALSDNPITSSITSPASIINLNTSVKEVADRSQAIEVWDGEEYKKNQERFVEVKCEENTQPKKVKFITVSKEQYIQINQAMFAQPNEEKVAETESKENTSEVIIKRGRGRPRKVSLTNGINNFWNSKVDQDNVLSTSEVRKRKKKEDKDYLYSSGRFKMMDDNDKEEGNHHSGYNLRPRRKA